MSETDDNVIILPPAKRGRENLGPAAEARIINDRRIDRHTVLVTFFKNKQAASQQAQLMTLAQLAEKIGGATAREKFAMPWLKLARFGDIRSEMNCLRTDANTRTISGCEAEHDAGTIPFEAAVATMREAGIRCLIYTSPSWQEGVREKWRILLPTSQELPPLRRPQLVARVHGMFGEGAITNECFVLSQAFLFGHLEGADHHEVVLDGDFIDERGDLDAGAIGKLVMMTGSKYIKPETYGGGPRISPCRSDEEIMALLPHSVLINKYGDKQWHNVMLSATASMIGRGWTDEQIFDATAPYCDAGWGDPDVEEMVDSGRKKWGRPEPVDPVVFAAQMRELFAIIEAQQAAAEAREEAELGRALDIWEQCQAIEGTPAERYLHAYEIEASEEAKEVLGYHEALPWQGGHVPALVTVISNAFAGTDSLVGVLVTALAADGKHKLGHEVIGEARYGAIMLAPFETIDNELAIAVGIETALRAPASELGIPVWIVPEVARLAEFPVLPYLPAAARFAPRLAGIERLTIVISKSQKKATEGAIAKVRARWEECGLKVRIVRLRGRP